MKIDSNQVNDIIKGAIARYQADVQRLEEVDCLLDKSMTEPKKLELFQIVFALQDVQGAILNLAEGKVEEARSCCPKWNDYWLMGTYPYKYCPYCGRSK